MMTFVIVLAVLVFIVCVAAGLSLRVVQQYESGVVFRLGKVQDPPRGPGLTGLIPVVDRITEVNRALLTHPWVDSDHLTGDAPLPRRF